MTVRGAHRFAWFAWFAFAIATGIAACSALAPACASTGGPELSEPMGYDPRTHEVFFKQIHWNEGGYRPAVYRLRQGHGPRLFEPVWWSIGENVDSAYRARVAALARRLKPLKERVWGTVPGTATIEMSDSVDAVGIPKRRYRVRVGWFAGPAMGQLRVTTYRDPAVRIVRWYNIPESRDVIGVVSFLGMPTEGGYEQQVPVVVPGEHEELTIPEFWFQTGYPKN
jgi:hypothetical protein